ncbi:MAG: lysoplasmalogenase [Gemmatirosa sp.]
MTLVLPAWTLPLVAAALGSAALHQWAEHRGRRAVVYACKPLTTALLLALALALPSTDDVHRWAIAVGLLLSLAGDVWLMLPRDRFVAGLASFLLAHVAYLVAFTRGVPFGASPVAFVPYLLVGAGMVAVLWPRLGRLRLPVLVYAAALVLMAGQAAARAIAVGGAPAALAAIGAGLFVVSDGVLAVNRFRTAVPHAQRWVMGTYVAAQLCLALSVAPAVPAVPG